MKINMFCCLAAMICGLALGSCSSDKKDSDNTSSDSKGGAAEMNDLPVVKLAEVKARPVDQVQEFTATVQAEVKNNIAPSTPIRIKKIFVEVGDRVKKNDKLVQMDAANLKQMELQLENKEIEFKRTDELYKVGGVSKSEWDAVKMAYEVQKTAYSNLLENTTLLSPIDGIVTARNYDNGDLYNGGTPVLTVEKITPVKLYINVSEMYFAKLKEGMPVEIKLDVYGDELFNGKINLIYPTIDAATRTFRVEVGISNGDMRVRPGMFARVKLNLGTENNVVVPDLAVIKQAGSGDRYVYVYENGKVSYNKVVLGRRMQDEYELKSGVANNSKVVVAGQARLVDGAEVQVEE